MIFLILTLILVILKLTTNIRASWLFVFAPLWLPFVLITVAWIILGLITLL